MILMRFETSNATNVQEYISVDPIHNELRDGPSNESRRRLLVDGFVFFNEIEMLLYRLTVLYDVVDYFILVEATKTFVGNSKPLYYNENKDIFAAFHKKLSMLSMLTLLFLIFLMVNNGKMKSISEILFTLVSLNFIYFRTI